MTRRRLRSVLMALIGVCVVGPVHASTLDLTTYYPAPDGEYRDLDITDTLTVGTAGLPTDLVADTGDDTPMLFAVRNNDIDGWNAGSTGGGLTIAGNLNIRNAALTSLFFVDDAANRVGIGTTTPVATLDVRGTTNTQMIHGYSDVTNTNNSSQVEILNQHFGTFDARNGFAAVWPGGGLRFIYMYLEGNPLIFQSLDKGGGFTRAVAINCQPGTAYLGTHNLIVGRPGQPKDGHATFWNIMGCSRQFKTDIRPLGAEEPSRMLEALSRAPLYRYHMKEAPADSRKQLGFIAEEAPREVVDGNGDLVSLGDSVGMLMASVQALRSENEDLYRRVEAL